ncbi:hypothetical protein Herbaro_05045 [Herbaspirillum sp. WKF16]|uniref:hypothetical protein n=1 Tax=Herbaspirillum sp. WKF16 TaxID=3028312 RepID=UPI0023A97DC7|nr:hypothetical protein [Herbaspirillum sp. WKF16]WDZ97163.1 hypothetical protein Herbaro_05045 [Herbaspirillum sp. WKF16]
MKTALPRAALLALVALLQAHAAHAAPPVPTMCLPGEKEIFSCATRAKKTASLCASADFSAKGGTLQYRFGAPGKTELQYPDTPQPAAGKFLFSSTMYSGGGEAHIRFSNGGYDYILFDRTVRTNFKGPTNDPQFSAGIVVRGPKGAKPSTRGCSNDASIKADAYEALPTEQFDPLD